MNFEMIHTLEADILVRIDMLIDAISGSHNPYINSIITLLGLLLATIIGGLIARLSAKIQIEENTRNQRKEFSIAQIEKAYSHVIDLSEKIDTMRNRAADLSRDIGLGLLNNDTIREPLNAVIEPDCKRIMYRIELIIRSYIPGSATDFDQLVGKMDEFMSAIGRFGHEALQIVKKKTKVVDSTNTSRLIEMYRESGKAISQEMAKLRRVLEKELSMLAQ